MNAPFRLVLRRVLITSGGDFCGWRLTLRCGHRAVTANETPPPPLVRCFHCIKAASC